MEQKEGVRARESMRGVALESPRVFREGRSSEIIRWGERMVQIMLKVKIRVLESSSVRGRAAERDTVEG